MHAILNSLIRSSISPSTSPRDMHLTWGFAVSVLGMCIHAENALQKHELAQRLRENYLRREARVDLARRGLVATETEIAKWKAERARAEAAAAAQVRTQPNASS